jgi:hypothetical protein
MNVWMLPRQPIATKDNWGLSAAFSVLRELMQSVDPNNFDFVFDNSDSFLCCWIDSNQTAD